MATVSTTKSIYLWQLLKVYTFLIIKEWTVEGLFLLLRLRFLNLCLGNRGRVLDIWNPNRYLTQRMCQPHKLSVLGCFGFFDYGAARCHIHYYPTCHTFNCLHNSCQCCRDCFVLCLDPVDAITLDNVRGR